MTTQSKDCDSDCLTKINADSVQSAGGLISPFGEFAAEFEDGHYAFEGGLFQFGTFFDGNPASIVFDGNGAVVVDLD